LHKRGRKFNLIITLLPLLLLFLYSGCIDKFTAPTWDVDLNVPLLDKSYTLLDVVNKDTTYLKSDASNLLYYSDSEPFNAIQVDQKLTLSPIETSSKFGLTSIAVTNPADQIVTLTPPTWPPVTGTTPIPVDIYQKIEVEIPQNTAFETATFESGTLKVTIANNNGSDLAFRVDSLVILDNRTTGSTTVLLRSNTPVSIAPASTGTISMDLAGKTLYSKLKADLYVYSPAKASVTIPANANTKITTSFSNLAPSSIVAPVPAQSPQTMSGAFTLDSESSLDTVKIATGSMSFTISNYFNVALQAVMTVTNLYTSANAPYSTTVNVAAKGSQVVNIPSLTDWSIRSASLTNQLGYTVVVTVQPTASAVSVSKTDSATVKVNMSQLILKSIHGKIKPTALKFDTTTVAIALNSLKNLTATNIHMTGLNVNLGVALSANVKLDFAGTMTGSNSVGTTAPLTIPTTRLNGGGTSSTVTLSSSELNTFINTFSTKPLNQLKAVYSATLNPAPSVSDPAVRISNTDSLYGKINIYAPLNVGITGGKLIDTTDVNISQENRSNSDKVQSATVALTLTNNLPAGLTFYGKFLNENGDSVLSLPPKNSNNTYPTTIAAANVDASGNVTSPSTTQINITLTGADVDRFLNSKKLAFTLLLNTAGSSGTQVRFYSNSAVKIYVAGEVTYRLSK
jgi:hypothetical protein